MEFSMTSLPVWGNWGFKILLLKDQEGAVRVLCMAQYRLGSSWDISLPMIVHAEESKLSLLCQLVVH